jgi:hypothetical protein
LDDFHRALKILRRRLETEGSHTASDSVELGNYIEQLILQIPDEVKSSKFKAIDHLDTFSKKSEKNDVNLASFAEIHAQIKVHKTEFYRAVAHLESLISKTESLEDYHAVEDSPVSPNEKAALSKQVVIYDPDTKRELFLKITTRMLAVLAGFLSLSVLIAESLIGLAPGVVNYTPIRVIVLASSYFLVILVRSGSFSILDLFLDNSFSARSWSSTWLHVLSTRCFTST